jgi:pimeloyl-ACP methyl ester carboxylesterase
MPTCSVDGVRLHYEEEGAGEPVLLIHGLGSSTRDWFEQVPYLAENHRVVRLDLRGHGRSEKPPGPYSIEQFAREAAVLLRTLNAAPAHVVGLSMGGMVALEMAAHPAADDLVSSLVVINSTTDVRIGSWADAWFYLSRRLAVQVLGMRRVGELIARRLFVKPDQEHLREEFVRRWAANDRAAYLASVDAIVGWSVDERLPRIDIPTLLVSSDHDYTPVASKNRAAARMPNARLAVVEDARHALPVERPDRLNPILGTFLAEQRARRSGPLDG